MSRRPDDTLTGHPLRALWTVPRCASTAFERMMIERGDHQVINEPYSRHYYFGPARVSTRFSETLPDSRPEDIAAALRRARAHGPVFIKDMAYHAEDVLADDDLGAMVNAFLIRDPAYALPSLARMWPDFTDAEAGYAAVERLFGRVQALGQDPPLIDSDDLLSDPEGLVRAYCERVGIRYRPEAMSWAPGMRPEWDLWQEWFQGVAQSTGFKPPRRTEPPPLDDPHLARAYARCRPIYERLRAHRLGPVGV